MNPSFAGTYSRMGEKSVVRVGRVRLKPELPLVGRELRERTMRSAIDVVCGRRPADCLNPEVLD